jgi:DNA-binding HxlR family transcriptional regulator
METTKCPIEITVALISGKWKLLIIRELLAGSKRFSMLQKSIGPVSAKMLTQQLREMETDGLVAREAFSEIPPRVEYSLTAMGQSLLPILSTMRTLGMQSTRHAPKCLFCKQCDPL